MHIHDVNNIICYYIFVSLLQYLLICYYVFYFTMSFFFYSVTLSIQAATSSTLGF